MLRIMIERTRHETKPTIFGYFFHEFLQQDVNIPHPLCTLLENKFISCLNDTSFYALSTKSFDYLKCFNFVANMYTSTLIELRQPSSNLKQLTD